MAHSTGRSISTPASPNADSAPRASALERTLEKYRAVVLRVARARGLSDADVDEVLQDVRVRLWKAGAPDETLDRLGASYMQRVAMSAAVDMLRRRHARREESLDDALHTESVPANLTVASPDRSSDDELAQRLSTSLAQLPRNRRVVVQLHLEGYSREEMSTLTGWSEAKVRNLLYRGLDELRALLRSSAEAAGD